MSDGRLLSGGRYEFVVFDTESSSVGIIRDTQNRDAWLQSTLRVPVEC